MSETTGDFTYQQVLSIGNTSFPELNPDFHLKYNLEKLKEKLDNKFFEILFDYLSKYPTNLSRIRDENTDTFFEKEKLDLDEISDDIIEINDFVKMGPIERTIEEFEIIEIRKAEPKIHDE